MVEKEKVRTNEHYRIFYSTELKQYILGYDTGTVCNEMYFRISEEEYGFSKTDIEHLDRIAYACSIFGTASSRYICSQKKECNRTDEQQMLAEILITEINASAEQKYK